MIGRDPVRRELQRVAQLGRNAIQRREAIGARRYPAGYIKIMPSNRWV
jgi:hypothetical protein